MFPSIDVVVGGQYGSESKGRVAAELVRQRAHQHLIHPVISVRVGGPNAGHVAVADSGKTYAMRQIPVGFVDPESILVIAAGSEVDPDVLMEEVELLERDGFDVRSRLYVDAQATLLEPKHRHQEMARGLNARTGSTAKGIGAARADRIWREARLVKDAPELMPGIQLYDPIRLYPDSPVVLEGTQGYGLGLHAGHYPQCTSVDTRAIDFLGQAGINPWDAKDVHVHVVVRPNPIRVAGNSGPIPNETSWEELGLQPELTTVTKKIRRVGRFDFTSVRRAVLANGPAAVCIHLAMADTVEPNLANRQEFFSESDLGSAIGLVNQLRSLAPVVALGTGPASTMWVEPWEVFGTSELISWTPAQYTGNDDMKEFQD